MRARSTIMASAFFLGLAPPVAQAQESAHRLTVMDEFRIQFPSDPKISPGGNTKP